MKIFSGTSNKYLSDKLIKSLDQYLSNDEILDCESLKIERFSDGEILPQFLNSIRNQDVYFVQTTSSSDSIMEILMVADASKRAGCKSFNLISPYMGYSRQDKTDHIRSSIGSKVLADILEKVGINTLLTIDLHSSSIQGFYNVPVIHLNGNKIFIDYLKNEPLDNLCVVAPDQGAVKRAIDFCKSFPDATFAMINKKRIKPNEVHSMELVGDVTGKNVIIVDDIADTLGTLKKAASIIISNGAKSVRAIATHGILSGQALENLTDSDLYELFVSDSLQSVCDINHPKLKVISSAPLIAKTLNALNKSKSVHEVNLV
jgi:ribose-phosphate pyrophosphokinase